MRSRGHEGIFASYHLQGAATVLAAGGQLLGGLFTLGLEFFLRNKKNKHKQKKREKEDMKPKKNNKTENKKQEAKNKNKKNIQINQLLTTN